MRDARHTELGDFLRSRRERLTPADLGLPTGQRRRTPGLRREEVAERAGLGVDWVVRLEQGRAINPSPATLDALVRALRLNATEAAHLRSLAARPDRHAFAREVVPDALRRIVGGLNRPAYVIGRRWDVLAWNDAAVEALTDFARVPEADRNILLFMLTDPGARILFGAAWAEEARRMVAAFRTTHDLWAGDPAFLDLLARLRAGSRDFAGWWKAHDVRGAGVGRKTLRHPALGARRFEVATFQSNDDPALRLVLYAPA